MSYDISYKNPETNELIKVRPWRAYGGTIQAELDENGKLIPATIEEADTNITYNYSKWYYKYLHRKEGIRWLYGKKGWEVKDKIKKCILQLGMVQMDKKLLEEKAKFTESDWNLIYELGIQRYQGLNLCSFFIFSADKKPNVKYNCLENGGPYWKATPGNAGYALHVLLGWIEQNPDGIFEGD